jgi:hypothetical protein
MRSVGGMFFIAIGIMMGYLVLTGKLPNSGNLINSNPQAQYYPSGTIDPNTMQLIPTPVKKGTPAPASISLAPQHGSGGGPLGLPTMKHLNDMPASLGGF